MTLDPSKRHWPLMVPDDRTRRQERSRQYLVILCALWALFAGQALADSFEDRRVRAGARLMRPLLAADSQLEQKIAANGGLTIWLIGAAPKLNAELAELIAPSQDPERAKIRGALISIQSYASLAEALVASTARADATNAGFAARVSTTSKGKLPVAVFFAAPLSPTAFLDWLSWGKTQHVLLFSPFEGHVERGMTAGLSVQAKVQPYLNSQSMRDIGLQLKPFFLRVSKVYP